MEILPDGNTVPPDNWQIANRMDVMKTIDLATEYVLHGDEHIKGLPILEIGGLKTVDRWEIEAYGNIQNMIREYSQNDDEQPLSIAAFGSPGSGKSFGIKQIAKHLLSKDKMEDVTFNLSQFKSLTELGVAFQQVRDICLRGRLPLVFFDEFDSAGLDGRPFGWLKCFLAPMQDGEFNDEAGVHPLGKCILVFAGGTAPTFKAFQEQSKGSATIFKAQKGPDFVSRIKGSIDIAGPNPRNNEEHGYILRRALLLRSFCQRHSFLDVKSNARFIDNNIVIAMLLVPIYKHGARSMETIIKLSHISGPVWSPSALPLGEQLSVHVNTRAFTDLLLLPVIENSTEGQIAQMIHSRYYDMMTKKGVRRANVKPWKDLSPHFKTSNINQARSYADKLALIGCEMKLRQSEGTVVASFTDKQIEKMAIQEHERWCAEKIEEGWEYASVRNDEKKQNDCLVEWSDLRDDVREWNREPVRNMLSILGAVGYAVYRKQ